MTHKQCICRKSSRFPICDGSHTKYSWCKPNTHSDVSTVVICSPSLTPLGEWWANHVQGLLFCDLSKSIEHTIQNLWILSDGIDIDILRVLLQQIPHSTEHWIHLSSAPLIPQNLLHRNNIELFHYQLPEDITLDQLTISSLRPCTTKSPRHHNIFVSHAVHDEPFLLPILQVLQDLYGIKFFNCANIPQRTEWYSIIESNLRQTDTVWAFCSTSFAKSTFCAFEIGLARGLDKTIDLISIDTSEPPAHLQHQNMASAVRTQHQRPWLSLSQTVQLLCQKLLFKEDQR